MDSFETKYRRAEMRWSECSEVLRLSQKELDEKREESQRWQAHSVLLQEKLDKVSAERDSLLEASRRECAAHVCTVAVLESERDAARKQRDGFLADLERVVAQRDAVRADLVKAKVSSDALAVIIQEFVIKNKATTDRMFQHWETAIAERDAARAELAQIKSDPLSGEWHA